MSVVVVAIVVAVDLVVLGRLVDVDVARGDR